MASHIIKGNWKQLSGKIKEKWGKLTDSDIDRINGRREMLVGKLQESYGKARADIEKEVDDFFDSLAA